MCSAIREGLSIATRGGSRILQWRVSSPSERGTEGRASKAPMGWGMGMGKKFSTYDMTSPLDYQVPYCATTADVSNLLEFVQKSVK